VIGGLCLGGAAWKTTRAALEGRLVGIPASRGFHQADRWVRWSWDAERLRRPLSVFSPSARFGSGYPCG